METREFLEKFLPDYEEKREETAYWHYYFPEAFANYEKKRKEELQGIINKVCKKQRENCRDNLFMADSLDWRQAGNSILTAKQPKMEEI